MIKEVAGNLGVVCPVCGYDCTHHGLVEVFERDIGEDGDSFILRPGSSRKDYTVNNPSRRRNAIRIHFEGECGHEWWMDLVQHKGNTFIEFTPTKLKGEF